LKLFVLCAGECGVTKEHNSQKSLSAADQGLLRGFQLLSLERGDAFFSGGRTGDM